MRSTPTSRTRLRLGRQRARHPGNDRSTASARRHYQPDQQQLGAVHAQHLRHHRHAQPDGRRALHARDEEARRRRSTDNNRRSARALAGVAARPRCSSSPCVIPCVPGRHRSATSTTARPKSKLSGTVVLSCKPIDELLTYASYSRGYKARRLQPRPLGAVARRSPPSDRRRCCAHRRRLDDRSQFDAGDQRRLRARRQI